MKAAIIGCGLIGHKRAKNLGGLELAAVCDNVPEKAEGLASSIKGCRAFFNWPQLLKLDEVGLVIICTTHDLLAPIALDALRAGKHVLIEKPGARSHAELEPVAQLAQSLGLVAKVGFNHRFHPAALKARELLSRPEAGPLMFVRARYGHGGRPGYDKEWRAQRKISGGGELIDQGLHLIDLARLFLGDFSEATGFTPTYFWDMGVEDNAFMQLKTASGQAAWLHASWTEWKNTFSFEIYARHAKLHWEGLGGSYGVEKLTHYQMLPQMGPPETTLHEFPGEDQSWALEMQDFLEAIAAQRRPNGDVKDCLAALEIADKIYRHNGIS